MTVFYNMMEDPEEEHYLTESSLSYAEMKLIDSINPY